MASKTPPRAADSWLHSPRKKKGSPLCQRSRQAPPSKHRVAKNKYNKRSQLQLGWLIGYSEREKVVAGVRKISHALLDLCCLLRTRKTKKETKKQTMCANGKENLCASGE